MVMFPKAQLQLVVASAFRFLTSQALRPLRLDSPLNQEYFVFSHNAATGYLANKQGIEGIRLGFFKNQIGNFTEQLGCGARAFDLRPAEIDGDIFFRHGGVLVPEISFQNGIQEILDWSASDTSELILLKISKCRDGENCDAISTVLANLGIEYITDCSEFGTLTVGEALNKSQVLAIEGSCFIQNFNDTLECHGFLPDDNDPANVAAVRDCVPDLESEISLEQFAGIFLCLQVALTLDKVNLFDCWSSSSSKDFPVTQLFNHLKEVAAAGPPQDGLPWQWQALWQGGEDTVVLSTFRPLPLPLVPDLTSLEISSLLKNNEESQINRLVLELVTDLVKNNTILNLVEVDFVCETYGRQLLSAVRPDDAAVGTPMPTSMASPPTTTPPTMTPPTTPTPTPSSGTKAGPLMFVSLFVILVSEIVQLV